MRKTGYYWAKLRSATNNKWQIIHWSEETQDFQVFGNDDIFLEEHIDAIVTPAISNQKNTIKRCSLCWLNQTDK